MAIRWGWTLWVLWGGACEDVDRLGRAVAGCGIVDLGPKPAPTNSLSPTLPPPPSDPHPSHTTLFNSVYPSWRPSVSSCVDLAGLRLVRARGCGFTPAGDGSLTGWWLNRCNELAIREFDAKALLAHHLTRAPQVGTTCSVRPGFKSPDTRVAQVSTSAALPNPT